MLGSLGNGDRIPIVADLVGLILVLFRKVALEI